MSCNSDTNMNNERHNTNDNPIFALVNSPPHKGSYKKGQQHQSTSMIESNQREHHANDSVIL